ncbi:Sodium- and chloride-dependent glycine transporter 2 [Bulinus truncatus]|nr:Sodium- and chloride-dependent glycine transporter 2 [Bulinus truncatus]
MAGLITVSDPTVNNTKSPVVLEDFSTDLSPSPKPKILYTTIERTSSQLRLLAESFILPGRASEVDQIAQNKFTIVINRPEEVYCCYKQAQSKFTIVINRPEGVTLPGANIGIKFYVIPDWSKLLEFKVWGDAAVQIFYSVGMAWGSLVTMASYNTFKHNVFRDAMIVPIVNCCTSVFAGFVIFSVLGYMAHTTNTAIHQVVDQGPGLIFVGYPEAISKLPLPHLWSVLFFLMILTVGIDSQFGMFETITSAFVDEYPRVLHRRKTLLTGTLCLVEFSLGIPMICQGGIYILQIVDWYSASFSLMLLSLMECLVISWVYGINRFMKDIELMLGKRPFVFWKIMWKFITPGIILFTWSFSVSQIGPVTLGQYNYPTWAIVMGWSCGLCSLIPIPLVAIIDVCRERSGTLVQRIRKLAQPAANWGPSQAADKENYYNSMNDAEFERYEASLLNIDLGRYAQMKKQTNINVSSSPLNTNPCPVKRTLEMNSSITM